MTKNHIEFVLSGYGVPNTDALADKLLEMFDEEAASYQHTINELNKALSENKGDLISRQAVDDVIYDYSRSHAVDYAQIMERIDKLPSVENKGEWIYTDGQHVCSKCNLYNGIESDFCPNCGADMRGD